MKSKKCEKGSGYVTVSHRVIMMMIFFMTLNTKLPVLKLFILTDADRPVRGQFRQIIRKVPSHLILWTFILTLLCVTLLD